MGQSNEIFRTVSVSCWVIFSLRGLKVVQKLQVKEKVMLY